MHFDIIYEFQILARSKVIKGVKRSNLFFNRLKNMNYEHRKCYFIYK